ncbi:hypothetical protein [Alicyclobacillus mali (ex Roth et al. 2021)]|uniref:hypothetical protein n=1 Tax=Alicyclobacillus mali (ex Roth et al. 2021) TaxID=1123961 RepID=UPI001E2ADD0C|nr:hypothetical protein [Alicyclobacillus mali (ex Roth et al. 2021)]
MYVRQAWLFSLFTPERDVVLVGRVSVRGRELRVRTTGGERVVRLDDVIGVE